MFRTAPAQWFEELIAKPMLARAVEVLAETGEVEFEFTDTGDPGLELSDLEATLAPYREVARKFRDYLPVPVVPDSVGAELLADAIARNMDRLQQWLALAGPLVIELENLYQRQGQLTEIADFLALLRDEDLNLPALLDAAPLLETRLFVLPAGTETPAAVERVLNLRVDSPAAVYLVTLGSGAACEEAERILSGKDGRGLSFPDNMKDGPVSAVRARLKAQADELAAAIAGKHKEMAAIEDRFGLPLVLGELRRLQWLVARLEGVPTGDYFAHLTGWTSDTRGDRLRMALEEASLPAVLSLTDIPPANLVPPTLIRNLPWIRPFEFFAGLMGTPTHAAADPSPLVAIIAPLLFGYMFGDVGQGLVILLAGLFLRSRFPPAGMLISGGAVSMVFGFLYGSVFTFEHLIPALWTQPLAAPLVILFTPLLCGGGLILLGMGLNGLEHFWENRFGYWLRSEAGIMVAYAALALWLLDRGELIWAVIGLGWYLLGNLWVRRASGWSALAGIIGDLLEYALQLSVNTISFVRVGAFALAHAGLGATVFSLADSSDSTVLVAVILLVGNIVIIALEGLVVGVQTTRLLLFEFFIRFLKGGGRPFRPMLPPDLGKAN